MLAWFEQLLTAPVFEDDEEKTRIAGLLNSILPAIFVITSILTLLTGLLDAAELGSLVTGAVTAALALALWFIMRRGYVQLASILLSFILLVNVTITVYFSGTIRDPIAAAYVVCIVITSLLIGARAAIVFDVLALLVLFGLLQAETAGLLFPAASVSSAIDDWIIYAAVFSITAVLLNLAARSINEALGRARRNERALDERAKEIIIFRELAENAADAILMSTLEGSITYANRTAYEMFGYDYERQEMMGMRISALIPEAETERVNQQTISTTLRTGSWRGELKQRRKDGSIFDADNTVFSIRDELGQHVALVSIVRDITEQKQAEVERERLQQEVIEAQRQTLLELSSPVIPVMERIIVMPLVGNIDTQRARDVTRTLLAGIREHQAQVVILDITGVPIVDSGVANYLNKTIQAARLKGARTIITGISDAVAETIVDLGIDWGDIETVSDLQTGLITALGSMGIRLTW